ncbi:MAG: DUF2721 domain-containing protein [Parasphingorhabdus sp.]|nr:DUF2721 domain-containing protein [Parasphingorhabdus sp.]
MMMGQPHIQMILQNALAPVFLLVALGALLNLFAGRLARIVDRSRALQQRHARTQGRDHELLVGELRDLSKRIQIVNNAILLGVIAAILACVLIGLLFFLGATGGDLGLIIGGAFLVAVCFMAASLVQFLREVRIAIRDIMIREEFLEREDEKTAPAEMKRNRQANRPDGS